MATDAAFSTIIAALQVGFIARLFGKHLEFVKPYLFPEEYGKKESAQPLF